MGQELHAHTFEPYVGTLFRVTTQFGDMFDATLAGVDRLSTSPRWEQFAVLFHGPADPRHPQGICRFEHDALGEFELFITPIVGSDSERTVYEACFNRPA
jgi:hypothetical protein